MRIPREFRPAAKVAKAHGWTIHPTHGGHLLWLSPTGHKVVSSASPSDRRALPNHLRKLRHKGLDI